MDSQVRLSEIKLDLSKIEENRLKYANRVYELQLHLEDQRIRMREELDEDIAVHKMRYDTKKIKLHLAALDMYRKEEKERDMFNIEKEEGRILPKDSLVQSLYGEVCDYAAGAVCGAVIFCSSMWVGFKDL